jgi:hypothetical protein
MLMAYLPTEKILVHGDLYSPPAANAPALRPTPASTSLMNNIRRLRLDVAQHVPIHGMPGSHAEFAKIFAGGTQ